ncbi:post-transcriptional regulator [Fictibacillus enclensis]|uniref:post-transcriptional regulator n=1 Tax=Fictibacillus enclensis TaxID=1017270 RepID=UPI0024C0B830|nr:post-transcriptional regulator [Fictibacillus enclensis]MDM5339233.1 post-transcriptional regulator [Fictibacillus enclensis]WHY70691.1 post-transcriptional regulator [Fictibacillus enclensis]
MNATSFEELQDQVEPALKSKTEEFHFLGYESVTSEEIWDCVIQKAQKKKVEVRLHVLVGLILNLSLTDFMNWLTLEAYKKDVK